MQYVMANCANICAAVSSTEPASSLKLVRNIVPHVLKSSNVLESEMMDFSGCLMMLILASNCTVLVPMSIILPLLISANSATPAKNALMQNPNTENQNTSGCTWKK